MKKNLLLSLMLMVFSISMSGQIGFKAGLNVATQSVESGGITVEPGSKAGLVLGANYTTALSESFSLRPGVQFSMKGYEIDFGILGSFSANMNYIDVPVDFVYTTSKFSVNFGPYLGLLMSASVDGEDVKDQVKSTEIGLNFGVGYSFGAIGIGLNYGAGLTNISNDDTADGTVTNQVSTLYVTYTLQN